MPSKKTEDKTTPIEKFQQKVIPEGVTEVTAEEASVKVRAIRNFAIDRLDPKTGKLASRIVNCQQEVFLTPDEAKEMCDRKFEGYIPVYGYVPETFNGMLLEGVNLGYDPMARQQIVRAVRVA